MNKKKVNKKDSDLEKKEKEKNKLLPNRLVTDSEKVLQYVLKMCQNGRRGYLLNQKKSETKRWYKNSSLEGQIDRTNTKEKSKLLVKCFVNSFRKNPPISAKNVPKLPEMSLFSPRKKSKKRIAISKLAPQ